MSSANIIAGIVFGAIGFSAFIYGKKQSRLKPMLIGGALIAYPYLITDTTLIVVLGAILTTALFIFRD